MKSLRILQVSPDSYGEVGGVSVHVRNISERLARRHDVTVHATNAGSRRPRYEVKNGVRVERFKCYAPSNAYFFSLEMLLRMQKAEFDVVHAHAYHAFPMHFAALANCKKFIVTTHFHGFGHSPFRNCLIRLLKPFGERTLRKADKIIAVSEYEKGLMRQQFGLAEDKIAVIPNGVDFSEFSGLRKRNREFRSILYVGYLFDYKGVHYLVEVLPKLADDVVLEIVGNGPVKSFLERRARELKVYDRVRFYENLSRRELLQKYFDADVFVLLSRYEAYSLVVAEALTAGTPCIVANTSALSEWVDNETCFGVGFPICLRRLAERISYVIGNGVDRKAIKKWIDTKILDWDCIAERIADIYYQ